MDEIALDVEMMPLTSDASGVHSNAYTVWSRSEAPAQRAADIGSTGGDEDDNVVVIDNLHKTYLLGVEGVAALRGVSLTIKRGEFVMLFGTSGGGKSTLLNVIGTIDRPTKGTVCVCGTRITDSTPDVDLAALRLNKLGFVFQTFNLISSMSALENVEMPLTLHGSLSPADRRKRCEGILRSFGMADRMDHMPSQLSGGEQQRVTIARAMVNFPDILLLDEPTGDLDSKNTEIVMKILVELNQEHGITLIMVTHDNHLRQVANCLVNSMCFICP
jgi:putative ABC transport system ATP-binding protein